MENKSITSTAKSLICMWNIGLFGIAWFLFYNRFTFDKYWLPGGIVSCAIYAIIYISFCSLYQAFRIASSSNSETMFVQMVSFGIADLILYAESCLIYNRYVNILPGSIAVLLQIFGTWIIILKTKQYMMKHFVPKKTLLLYGNRAGRKDAEFFVKRLLAKYKHLFDITSIEYDGISESQLLGFFRINDVVILYEVSEERRGHFMKLCIENKKKLYFTPRIEDILCQGASIKSLLDTPLFKYEYKYESRKGYVGKRLFDISFSFIFIIITLPLMLVTVIAIKAEDHGPALFRQKRCTKDGKVFEILKFRSMIVDAEKNGVTPCKNGDTRITKVGKIIRTARIDELPQLFNVLKGDMSFVGPRPERIEHVRQYIEEIPEFAYRMRVKGGLTGYAQIYGKYNTSAYDKLRLDLMYIENQSLFLDLKILMLTLKTGFQSDSTEGFTEDKCREINRNAKDNMILVDELELYRRDRLAR